MRERPVRHAATRSGCLVEPRQRGEQPFHALGIPAVRRCVRHAEPIGLELIFAAVLEEQHAERDLRESLKGLRLGHENSENREAAAGQRLARVGRGLMARVDMTDLVAEHGRQLRFVAQERHDAAREIDVAAGQRERVHRRLVDDRERPRQVRPVRRLRQPVADTADVPLQLGVFIEPHLLADFGVSLLPELDLFRLGHQDDLTPARSRIRRAAAGDHHDQERPEEFHDDLAGTGSARVRGGLKPAATCRAARSRVRA